MKARPNFVGQVTANAPNLVTAGVLSAALAVSPPAPPTAQPIIGERRFTSMLSSGGFSGGSGQEPLPIVDVARPPTAGTATLGYRATWRSVDDAEAIASLKDAGLYWFRGGPTHPQSSRHRHHLQIEAKTAEEAAHLVRAAVERAGGESKDITISRPDPERIKKMAAAAREAAAS